MKRSERVSYHAAGVDLDAADASLNAIRTAVQSTYTPGVLAGLGAFGGLFALPAGLARPVLVASTDSVGTKTMVAASLGRFDTIGEDLVNHCVNDILVQGARPLFFLDYLASSRLVPERIAALVEGVARGCRAAGMALLGGETAELPGVYQGEEFDIVGTVVGLVERERLIDGSRAQRGDVVLALASGGLQTNGYSLARKVLADQYHEPLAPEGRTVGEALLAPHRSFLSSVTPLLEAGLVNAMAHITGGGIPGNLPRVLPDGIGADIDLSGWPVPAVFELIARLGPVADDEMQRVFNLGVGFVVVVPADRVDEARELCPEPLEPIGRLVAGRGVRFVR